MPGITSGDVARGAVQIVKQLFALGFLQIDGPLDALAFVDRESAHITKRSLVTS